MQRYRINHRLIIGLCIGFIVVAVSAHFLHGWRISSRADEYRIEAAQKLEEEKYLEAFELQHNFIRFRPDDNQARIDLANMAIDIYKNRFMESTLIQKQTAWGVIDDTIRRTGDADLRREFAKMILTYQPPKLASNAIDLLDELLRDNPDDTELNQLKARAMFRAKDYWNTSKFTSELVGYDTRKKEFSDDKVIIEDQPEIYYLLAQCLRMNSKDTDSALQVVERMVEKNPDSYKAHLNYASFLSFNKENEKAAASIERAYELNPTDLDVLARKGSLAFAEKNYEESARFFRDAVKEYPNNHRLYRSLASAELAGGNTDEALEVLEEGLLKFQDKQGIELNLVKIDILLNKDDYSGIEKIIEKLTGYNLPAINAICDFHRTRILIKKGSYADAIIALEKVRPQLLDAPQKQIQAGVMLAACYEQLGKRDLARQTYLQVLNEYPNNLQASQGLKRVEKRLGLANKSEDSGLNDIVRETLALPENEQDWDRVNAFVDKTIADHALSEFRAALLRFKVLLQRKRISEAEKQLAIAEALEPNNVDMLYNRVSLTALDPQKGSAPALELLDKITSEHGSTFRSRTLRASLLLDLDLDDETLVQELLALTKGIDDWGREEKVRLYEIFAIQFQQLGKPDKAGQLWNKVLELAPNNLPMRMKMFSIALQQKDDLEMDKAQEALLDLVKDENDPTYVLTVAQRKLSGFAEQSVTRDQLQELKTLLDQALMDRPQWHELHIIYGQLLLTLQEDLDIALEHFEEALKYGPANSNALVWHVKLLAQFGKIDSALEKMELLPKAVKERVLGNLEAELLWNAGRKQEALAAAQKVADVQQDNAQLQAWYANFSLKSENYDDAAKALKHAIELDPSQGAFWTKLADVYLKEKNYGSLYQTLRDAQLAVDAELMPLLIGKEYEYRGFFQNAEDIYESFFAESKEDLNVLRKMAEFYKFWAQFDSSKMAEFSKYLNLILREAYEGRAPLNNPQVAWAFDTAVRILASQNNYIKSVQAQKLLLTSANNGELTDAKKILLGEILTSLGDPKSQLKAIKIFKELHNQRKLGKSQILQYAKLLSRTGDWKGSESLLTDALPDYRNDPTLWSAYINLLIDRKEYSKAASRLNRYAALDPDPLSLIELRARLASQKGDVGELRRLLQTLLPPTKGALNAAGLKKVFTIAQLATKYEDYELAEKLLRFYVKRMPASINHLASYLSMHGDADEGFELLEPLFADNKDDTLRMIVRMMRERRKEIGDKYDETILKMFRSAIREDPDAIARRIMNAEFLEVTQNIEESIKIYDELLDRDDLNPITNATISNNLGYLLAISGKRLQDATDLIEQAMSIIGPVDDMLDSRAVVRIAREEYDLAVEDLQFATSVSQDPVKYYHLARALLLSGNEQAALKAWEQAQQRGFAKELLYILEFDSFVETEKEFEKLQSQNARL